VFGLKQNRWKSKVLWLSIGSSLFLIYNSIAAQYNLPVIQDELIGTIINTVLGIMVTFGVINNPTDANNL
jgi:phi LC3 family holin